MGRLESKSLEPHKSPVKKCSTEKLDDMDKSTRTKRLKHGGMQAGAAQEEVWVCFMNLCYRTTKVLTAGAAFWSHEIAS